VLRDLERTLTDQEANQLRDRIYAAIHQGAAHQWADEHVPIDSIRWVTSAWTGSWR
jgi:hypothetical protein